VVEKQDGIEDSGEIFDADSGQFFGDFTGNEVVAWGFFWDITDPPSDSDLSKRLPHIKKLAIIREIKEIWSWGPCS
jgi:hypothetical protein